ncbi:MAG: hypothetical protein EAZ40_01795 [Rhodobacterales bacterium]|nr:MAG: hypothetical protein EAZ40_01795 [Rhodobacterales bacterium]
MIDAPTAAPRLPKIAAVTHVRNDDFFLDLWVRHYGKLIGRQNCFVILDGDDWSSTADLSDVNVIVVPRWRRKMHRFFIDRRMQQQQMDLLERIFGQLGYDYVLKGDCDEYVVPDPRLDKTIQDAVLEADAVGAIYSMGINVLHDVQREAPLDPSRDVMSQRHVAVLSRTYCKVNLMSRTGFEQGLRTCSGGHFVIGDHPVHVSKSFVMLHLGWGDIPMWRTRAQQRLAVDRDNSFKEYIAWCEALFGRLSDQAAAAGPLDLAIAAARQELCYTDDGQRVLKPNGFRHGNFEAEGHKDYLVRLDDRFHGCLG